MDVIESVLQSNAEFFACDLLRLRVDIVSSDVGRGPSKVLKIRYLATNEYRLKNPGIFPINNADNKCLAWALAVAIEKRKAPEESRYHLMRRCNFVIQKAAEELCQRAGVDLTNGATDEEIRRFQTFLTDYTIVIFNRRDGRDVKFQGPVAPGRITLNLFYENNHFDVITNLTAAFGFTYVCEVCRKGSKDKYAHLTCPFKCTHCYATPKCQGSVDVTCRSCREFAGEECLRKHRNRLCKILKKCEKCHSLFWLNRKGPRYRHVCNTKFCEICHKQTSAKHVCFIQPVVQKQVAAANNLRE